MQRCRASSALGVVGRKARWAGTTGRLQRCRTRRRDLSGWWGENGARGNARTGVATHVDGQTRRDLPAGVELARLGPDADELAEHAHPLGRDHERRLAAGSVAGRADPLTLGLDGVRLAAEEHCAVAGRELAPRLRFDRRIEGGAEAHVAHGRALHGHRMVGGRRRLQVGRLALREAVVEHLRGKRLEAGRRSVRAGLVVRSLHSGRLAGGERSGRISPRAFAAHAARGPGWGQYHLAAGTA